MGPKLKLTKNGWEVCTICNCFILPADVTKHVSRYHGNVSTPTDSSAKTPKLNATPMEPESSHGFIKNRILHASVKELHMRGEEVSKLPASTVDDVVLLHPSAMTMCQLTIGFPVLVWSSPTRFAIQSAWPAKDGIRKTEIGVSPRTLDLLSSKTGATMHAQKLPLDHQFPALELTLQTRDERKFYGSKAFEDFIRYTYDGRPLIIGCSLGMHFYGQTCEITVVDVTKPDTCTTPYDESHKTNDSVGDTTSVDQDLANLSLNSSAVKEDSFCVDSSFDEVASPSRIEPSQERATRMAHCSTPERQSAVAAMCDCQTSRPDSANACFYIHLATKIKLISSAGATLEDTRRCLMRHTTTFDDIGGLVKQIQEICRFIFMSETEQQKLISHGLQPPNGIVMFGPSGTGKTLIAKAIANKLNDRFVTINAPELYSNVLGEVESRLQEIFSDAINRAPSVVFIDEIDTLCSKRSSVTSHLEERIVSELVSLMDNLPTNTKQRVIVLAATNRLDNLTSAMRRQGRFGLEIEIGIPTVADRTDILCKLLKNVHHSLSNEDIQNVASIAHGYVGADLASLCSTAGIRALKRSEQEATTSCSILVTLEDLKAAATEIKPSVLREVLVEVPKVFWNDIGGLDDLKRKLKQAVEWPLKHPDSFRRMGISPPKGVLMYGPPGCSKTMIAKAVATESGLNFIAIKGPELFSKWVGESERAVREVFRKARAAAPSVVFFDEIDALASERGTSSGNSQVGDRVLAQLLTEIDGLEKLQGVTILAASNRPDMIDQALLRPGRLDRIVYVPLPDKDTRKAIFEIQFRHIPTAIDVDVSLLADRTHNYSGAEVVAVCQEAALMAMEESLEAMEVHRQHFEDALSLVRPRISAEMIKFYEDYSVQGQQMPK